ncbi:hypothetical protein [Pseudoalteromonas sp. B62]
MAIIAVSNFAIKKTLENIEILTNIIITKYTPPSNKAEKLEKNKMRDL